MANSYEWVLQGMPLGLVYCCFFNLQYHPQDMLSFSDGMGPFVIGLGRIASFFSLNKEVDLASEGFCFSILN